MASATSGTGSGVVGRVSITPGDPCYCAPPCSYYLGVDSTRDFFFYSLVGVEGSAKTAIVLLDGVPQDGALDASAGAAARTQFYNFSLVPSAAAAAAASKSPALTVSLTQYYGSTLLIASWVTPWTTAPPTAATAMYSARVVEGTATLAVPRTDSQARRREERGGEGGPSVQRRFSF